MSYNGQSNLPYGYAGLDINGLVVNAVLPAGQDAAKIANGAVSNTEFQYLDGVIAPLQQQIDAINAGYIAFEADAMSAINIDITNPGTDTFDTYVASIGDVIFLAFQTDAKQNGLYIFNGTSALMTRAQQYNTWDEIVGSRVFVAMYGSGSAVYAGTVWQCLAKTGGVLGTDPINYLQIQQNYVGGTGVSISGNVVSIGQAVATNSNVLFNSVQSTIDIGTHTKFVFIQDEGPGQNITSAVTTAERTFSLPDADSNSVVPISAVSNKFVTNIDANGVQQLAFASVAGLSDVTLTSIAANQFLQYNGSAWVNVATNATVIGQALGLSLPSIGAVGINDSINLAISKLVSGIQRAAQIKTADYTMLITDDSVQVDTAGVVITMFDPATSVTGLEYLVYNNSSGSISVVAHIAGADVTKTIAPYTSLKLRVAGSSFLPA